LCKLPIDKNSGRYIRARADKIKIYFVNKL
jgi:hypothetical protein